MSRRLPTFISSVKAKLFQILTEAFSPIIVNKRTLSELGLTSSEAVSRIEQIVKIWSDSLNVQFRPFSMTGRGGVRLTAVQANYQDVLGSEAAWVFGNEAFCWLGAILLNTSIQGYFYLDPATAPGIEAYSRTDSGVMSKGKNWTPPVTIDLQDILNSTEMKSFLQTELTKLIL